MELPNYQMTNQLVLFVIAFEATHTMIKFADVPVTDPFVCNIDNVIFKSTIESCCQMFSNEYRVTYEN